MYSCFPVGMRAGGERVLFGSLNCRHRILDVLFSNIVRLKVRSPRQCRNVRLRQGSKFLDCPRECLPVSRVARGLELIHKDRKQLCWRRLGVFYRLSQLNRPSGVLATRTRKAFAAGVGAPSIVKAPRMTVLNREFRRSVSYRNTKSFWISGVISNVKM